MKRVKSISKVIELKEREKEEREDALRKAKDALDKEQSRLDNMEAEMLDTLRKMEAKQCAMTIDARELGLLHDYCLHLDRRIKSQKTVVLARQRDFDIKQQELLEAHKEKKVLDAYRGRLVSRIVREEEKTEQKNMDSIFIMRGDYGK